MYQMQSTLSLYEFMDERLERLQVCVTTVAITLTPHVKGTHSLKAIYYVKINLRAVVRDMVI
jgi:hypothetical protein